MRLHFISFTLYTLTSNYQFTQWKWPYLHKKWWHSCSTRWCSDCSVRWSLSTSLSIVSAWNWNLEDDHSTVTWHYCISSIRISPWKKLTSKTKRILQEALFILYRPATPLCEKHRYRLGSRVDWYRQRDAMWRQKYVDAPQNVIR